MKKILYICGARGFLSEKPRRKIADVIQCWRRVGYDVIHLCGGDIYADASQTSPAKAPALYHANWYRKKILSPLYQSASERRDIKHNERMIRRVREIVEAEKPGLIWERSNRLSTCGLDVAKEYHLPFVLEWKDHLVDYRLSLYHRRAIKTEKRKNREADFVVVESQVLKDQLSMEGVDRDKIYVAHNAANPDEFVLDKTNRNAQREEFGIDSNKTVVGYAGSYAFYHNMILIAKAAEWIRAQGREDIVFVLVGRGKQHDEVHRAASQKGLLGNMIRMEGWVAKEKVPAVLSSFDIAVLPGTTDIICPIKIQEYMAMGLPLIAPDYQCNREVIDQEKTGVLFTPDDPVSLGKAVLSLADNKTYGQEIGRNAREAVSQKFTWEKTWGKALQDILSRMG